MPPRDENRLRALLFGIGLLCAASVPAQTPSATGQRLTLDEAVSKVQRDTGGTILSAEPRNVGRNVEFRIKVLTPQGHVRVISVSADAGRPPGPVTSQSTKNSAGNPAGNKEKH